ncbi:MAG: hypothetical protein DSY42_04880 [Aquifex sp.]|nr:MAG: hypothetical protein DSY42_04880 [Aquifex sp.]
MKAVEIQGKKVYVESLKFKDFIRFVELINKILKDAENDTLRVSKYLEEAIPLMSAMSGLPKEEVENLKASDALKLLRTCIEVIKEDEDFLKNLKEAIQTLRESLSMKQ